MILSMILSEQKKAGALPANGVTTMITQSHLTRPSQQRHHTHQHRSPNFHPVLFPAQIVSQATDQEPHPSLPAMRTMSICLTLWRMALDTTRLPQHQKRAQAGHQTAASSTLAHGQALRRCDMPRPSIRALVRVKTRSRKRNKIRAGTLKKNVYKQHTGKYRGNVTSLLGSIRLMGSVPCLRNLPREVVVFMT